MIIELLELYYKKYTDTVQASDYVAWAIDHLYSEPTAEINKLASVRGQLNIFEVEEMFEAARKSMQYEEPSEEKCVSFHVRQLHSQLIMPNERVLSIVKEIYDCAITHDLTEIQMNWQDVSDAIDEFQYGGNPDSYTLEKIHNLIVMHARRLWHVQPSKNTFKEIIGQKVTAIDFETQFSIHLEKGFIEVECPWRIRDTNVILIGDTDIQSQKWEWKTVKELLINKTMVDIQVFEECPLLIIQFDNLFLDIIHTSAFFDGWRLSDDEDFFVFSMHGGHIV
ncbi:hypothetical protein [Terribacillus saccharophilus]|uniref:hypothetical protein n=1 Tax=Terribacillus saccharophilus TaxID=361277 RepID=UPI002989C72C|nr:hypothetical protein [Terribacillus saccharophilus]MCM3227369.1 hypothetical protein [Terribacillus saccharophilus]